jgi:hypothetical protein
MAQLSNCRVVNFDQIGEKGCLSWRPLSFGMPLHLPEHLFHIGQPELLFARSLMFSQRAKLPQGDSIALDWIFLCEVGPHIVDKGAGDGGREIGRFPDHAPSSSTKPGGIFGGLVPSLALQTGQGIPGAPQPQACSPSHGRSGCASQTHRHPSQPELVMRTGLRQPV